MARLRRFFVPGYDHDPLADGFGEKTYGQMCKWNNRRSVARGLRPYSIKWLDLDKVEVVATIGLPLAMFGPRDVVSYIFSDDDPVLLLSSGGLALRVAFGKVHVLEYFQDEKVGASIEPVLACADADAEAA